MTNCKECGSMLWESITGRFCPNCQTRVIPVVKKCPNVVSHQEMAEINASLEAKAESDKYLQVTVSRTETTCVFVRVDGDFDATSDEIQNIRQSVLDDATNYFETDYGSEEIVGTKEVTRAEAKSYDVLDLRKGVCCD